MHCAKNNVINPVTQRVLAFAVVVTPDGRILALRSKAPKTQPSVKNTWVCTVEERIFHDESPGSALSDLLFSRLSMNVDQLFGKIHGFPATKVYGQYLTINAYHVSRMLSIKVPKDYELAAFSYEWILDQLSSPKNRMAFSTSTEDAFKILNESTWRPK